MPKNAICCKTRDSKLLPMNGPKRTRNGSGDPVPIVRARRKKGPDSTRNTIASLSVNGTATSTMKMNGWPTDGE